MLTLHGSKQQSMSLSSSRFTLMMSHAPTHVTLLSLQKRCRTGSETVLLCVKNINSLTCELSVIHRTQLNFFRTYYTAPVLQVISITVIKIFTNSKLQLSVFFAKSAAAPVLMEFYNSYTVTLHYSVHHGLSLVHYAPRNTISYVRLRGIIKCTFPIKSPNKKCISFSCHLHVIGSKTHSVMPLKMQLNVTPNFLSLDILFSYPFSNTLSLQLFPVRYRVLWPHKTVQKPFCLCFNFHVSKEQLRKESCMNKPQ